MIIDWTSVGLVVGGNSLKAESISADRLSLEFENK